MSLDDVIARAAADAAFVARFFSHTEQRGECLEWTGCRRPVGYGLVNVWRYSAVEGKHRTASAHRVAYAIAHGALPSGLCILHRCDNPGCVLAEHLFVGTKSENNADKKMKGRAPRLCFESNGNAKITRADMEEILSASARGESQRSIARRLGVNQACVWQHMNRHRLGVYG